MAGSFPDTRVTLLPPSLDMHERVVFGIGNQDTRSDRLWVFFDEGDRMTHYGASFATHHTQYAMPWEDIHEDADDRAADAEREGLVPAGDPSK